MVKKLKGKATEELKGEKKRKRLREYEEAKKFWMEKSPLILFTLVILIAYFTYSIYK